MANANFEDNGGMNYAEPMPGGVFTLNTLLNIGLTVIVICIIIGVLVLILAQLSPASLCQSWCDQHNGTYWIASDCNGDTRACSGFCVKGNLTLYCKEILENITEVIG